MKQINLFAEETQLERLSKLYPFAGNTRNFEVFNLNIYMNFEAGM